MLVNTRIPLPAGWAISSERLVCLLVVGSGPAAVTEWREGMCSGVDVGAMAPWPPSAQKREH